MNFPRWIRSEVTIEVPDGVDEAALIRSIAARLVAGGATDLAYRDGATRFGTRNVRSGLHRRVSALSLVGRGWFAVRRVSPSAFQVRYELDLTLIAIMGAVILGFLAVSGVSALLRGAPFELLPAVPFFGIGFPAAYAACWLWARRLFAADQA